MLRSPELVSPAGTLSLKFLYTLNILYLPYCSLPHYEMRMLLLFYKDNNILETKWS